MKKRKSISYLIEDISCEGEAGFKAVIPALGNGIVYGKDLKEIEKGVKIAFEMEGKNYTGGEKLTPQIKR